MLCYPRAAGGSNRSVAEQVGAGPRPRPQASGSEHAADAAIVHSRPEADGARESESADIHNSSSVVILLSSTRSSYCTHTTNPAGQVSARLSVDPANNSLLIYGDFGESSENFHLGGLAGLVVRLQYSPCAAICVGTNVSSPE